MIGVTFVKENRQFTIDKIYGEFPYLCNLSFDSGKQKGTAINQPLNKLALKIFEEKYRIVGLSGDEQIIIFEKMFRLIC